MSRHRVEDLIVLFNDLFLESHNTILERGDDEPVYLPADQTSPHHRIVFAHGYFASALHEIAHWCVAGPKRRKLLDFGYWYRPDGRTDAQQAEFEKVEIKPQALEWIFSLSCGKRFVFSADNLSGEPRDNTQFKKNVAAQARRYVHQGLPKRAKRLSERLRVFYETPAPLTEHPFDPAEI